MRYSIKAEIDREAYEAFRSARKNLQDVLNSVFESENYGEGLPVFHFLVIMRRVASSDFPEVFKYYPKKRKCDYRVNVDIDRFLAGGDNDRIRLILMALKRAIEHLINEAPIELDVTRLQTDFEKVLDQINGI